MSTDNKKAPAGENSEGHGQDKDHQQVYPAVPIGVNEVGRMTKALDVMLSGATCADCGEKSSVGILVRYRKDEDATCCDICYSQRRYEHMNQLNRVSE